MNVIWSSFKASSKSTLKYIDEIFVHPARQHHSILFILHQVISLRKKCMSKSQQSGANDSKGDCLWQHGAECFFLHPSIMNSIQQFGLTFDHHTYWYFVHVFTDHVGNSHSCSYTHAHFSNTVLTSQAWKSCSLWKIDPTKPIIALDYKFQQFV